MRRAIAPTIATTAVLAILAGCGSSSYTNTTGAPPSTPAATADAGGAPTTHDGIVASDSSSPLGEILVNTDGFTLYDFRADSGTSSSCYDACASVWPPLLIKQGGQNAQAQGAADRSLLGTTPRKDGTTQVTYAGHPLYTYAGDQSAGDTKGNNFESFGDEWYALTPAGKEAKG